MDKFFIEERFMGMYESYNSPILEEFKKKTNKGKKSEFKQEFINYLVFKYNNQDIKYDFKNAKTDKEKQALVKKYSKDFAEWEKRQKGLRAILLADIVGLGLTVAGAPGAGLLMAILCWGGIIAIANNDYNAREKQMEDDYNRRHKK